METKKVSELRPHELNKKIYGELALDDDFLNSVKQKGILTAIIITYDNRIISGHRRWMAAKRLGIPTVPIFEFAARDELDIEDALISANQQRERTVEQKAREYKQLKRIEAEKAKKRQEEAGEDFGRGKQNNPKKIQNNEQLQPNSAEAVHQTTNNNQNLQQSARTINPSIQPQPKQATVIQLPPKPKHAPQSRDLAAKQVGMGRDVAEKAAGVVQIADELKEAGKEKEADELLNTLNTKSVNKAYQQVRTITNNTPIPKIKSNATFNKEKNSNIEWAQWTWNPVTGCKHGCKYCYARDIATRFEEGFPKGFEPDFRENRLVAPQNTKLPEIQTIGDKSVFVCSMADLFGEFIPQEWIDAVLEAVQKAPQWNFLFLTKNPERLATITWPNNAWVGTTVDTQARVKRAEEAFKNISAKIKFLSCEPLSEELRFSDIGVFDWVIVGARSKNSNTPAMQPERQWVQSLLMQAWDAGCMTYCKPNLKSCIKEYPMK